MVHFEVEFTSSFIMSINDTPEIRSSGPSVYRTSRPHILPEACRNKKKVTELLIANYALTDM
jgi:hypothetical protein